LALALLQPIGLGSAAISTGAPLPFGLVRVSAAIYRQVVVNDAMSARYVPPANRAKAFRVPDFLGFSASRLAVPSIAASRDAGGFPTMLAAAACMRALVLCCAPACGSARLVLDKS